MDRVKKILQALSILFSFGYRSDYSQYLELDTATQRIQRNWTDLGCRVSESLCC